MLDLTVHTLDTAPEGSRDTLAGIAAARGSFNNMFAVLAESPAVLKGYVELSTQLMQNGSLSRAEFTVVLLSVSREHGCRYCVPIYSRAADRLGIDPAVVRAVRDGGPIDDPRLAALRDFTTALLRQRGRVSEEQTQSFLAAGFGNAQVLEVLGGIALKTLTNYLTQFSNLPLDDDLADYAWDPVDAESQS